MEQQMLSHSSGQYHELFKEFGIISSKEVENAHWNLGRIIDERSDFSFKVLSKLDLLIMFDESLLDQLFIQIQLNLLTLDP